MPPPLRALLPRLAWQLRRHQRPSVAVNLLRDGRGRQHARLGRVRGGGAGKKGGKEGHWEERRTRPPLRDRQLTTRGSQWVKRCSKRMSPGVARAPHPPPCSTRSSSCRPASYPTSSLTPRLFPPTKWPTRSVQKKAVERLIRELPRQRRLAFFWLAAPRFFSFPDAVSHVDAAAAVTGRGDGVNPSGCGGRRGGRVTRLDRGGALEDVWSRVGATRRLDS